MPQALEGMDVELFRSGAYVSHSASLSKSCSCWLGPVGVHGLVHKGAVSLHAPPRWSPFSHVFLFQYELDEKVTSCSDDSDIQLSTVLLENGATCVSWCRWIGTVNLENEELYDNTETWESLLVLQMFLRVHAARGDIINVRVQITDCLNMRPPGRCRAERECARFRRVYPSRWNCSLCGIRGPIVPSSRE